MTVDMAIEAWKSVLELAGPGAHIHLTGGEPFLVFDRLAEILSEAHTSGLPALNSLETNGSWANSEQEVREKLSFLKSVDLQELKISYDPFHAEFIDVQTIRYLKAKACEILGADKVKVKWEKYLENPIAFSDYLPTDRQDLCQTVLREDRCRFTGRAAEQIGTLLGDREAGQFGSRNCRNAILGAKGVHIDPYGHVFNGQCSGIIVGNLNQASLDSLWRQFDPSEIDFWKILFHNGPAGFYEEAVKLGYPPDKRYASKCHLCSDIRRFFFDKRMHLTIIGPTDCYGR